MRVLKTNKKRHFMLAIIIGMSAFVSTAASTITWEIAKIDSIGDVGLYCDLGIDNMGHLYVVYLREDERTLKALSNNGGSWGSSWILDSSGAVAGYCGIALDGGGVPRVSYRRDDTHALWYAGPESPRVWTVEAIDEPGDVGSYCDLTLDNLGNFHAAYLRADEKALKHIASDLGYWLAPATVDASGAVAGYCVTVTTRMPSGTPARNPYGNGLSELPTKLRRTLENTYRSRRRLMADWEPYSIGLISIPEEPSVCWSLRMTLSVRRVLLPIPLDYRPMIQRISISPFQEMESGISPIGIRSSMHSTMPQQRIPSSRALMIRSLPGSPKQRWWLSISNKMCRIRSILKRQ